MARTIVGHMWTKVIRLCSQSILVISDDSYGVLEVGWDRTAQILCNSVDLSYLDESLLHKHTTVAKQDRGFASMDRDKQRRIASMGGTAAHAKGLAHEWNAEEARVAGRKGAVNRRRQPDRVPSEKQNPKP